MKKVIAIVLAVLIMAFSFAGCASWQRAKNDLKADIRGGLNRVINVYTADGKLLATYEGKMENYIVINGKKTELTEEQLRQLGIQVKNNPFRRRIEGEYYRIYPAAIYKVKDFDDNADAAAYESADYFNDEEFAEQVMLHQLLYRKLLKYSYDNNAEDCEWNGENQHYLIYCNRKGEVRVDFNNHHKMQGAVYFSSRDVAEKAIKEVIEPFMKEHPNFEW